MQHARRPLHLVAHARDLADVSHAVDRGARALAARQRDDGSWRGANDAGPLFTGAALALEGAIGSLRPDDAAAGERYLRAAQRPDGSVARWPGSDEGGHEATSFWYAGMRAAGVADDDPALRRARRFVDAGGGFGENLLVVRAALAAAGVLDPRSLPDIPLAYKLIPGHEAALGRLFGVNALVALHLVPPLVRGLRHDGAARGRLRALESRRAVAYLSERQDAGGGFAGVPFYTLLMALALRLHGVARDDGRVARALAFARDSYARGPAGLAAGVFHCHNWDSAHSLRALAGLAPHREAERRAVEYLLRAQSLRASPYDWQTPPPGGRRVGGWAFQAGNERNPDIDSTAVALSALAASGEGGVARERALSLGTDWILSMQNPDGGFAAFSHGKRPAPPGALYLPAEPGRGLRLAELPARVARWIAEHGDPSTADVTGRVLHGLGPRLTWRDARVTRAVAFLRRHQTADGAFWGRWAINYLPATSYIVAGLRAVGLPADDPMVERAVRWMRSCQNADGGFGETPRSYELPEHAGRGPSSAQVTGVVAWALASAGGGGGEALRRAARFLVERQEADGSWRDEACYGVVFPHRYYYRSDLFPTHLALEGLRAWRRRPEGGA